MINLILSILIILIIILIIVTIISLTYNNNNNNTTTIIDNIIQSDDVYDDYIFFMSSETETTLRALNNILIYDKNFTFISLTQLAGTGYDTGIAKYNITDITTYETSSTNYKVHFIQGFTEIKENRSYMSHKYSRPLNKPIKIIGNNASYAYIMQFERLVDNVVFYYIQISQEWLGNYLTDKGYKNISALLQYIIKNYPGEYIITGEFVVQGHEKIFEYHLGKENYHIFPYHKYITCNDNEGIASPDGIYISKKLYKGVKYNIDIYPGYSYQHYMLTAKLYINGPEVTESIIDKRTLLLFEHINLQETKRTNLYNNPGIFDPNIHIGDIQTIKESPFNDAKGVTYQSNVTTDKLNKIT